MITIINRQRKIPFDTASTKKLIEDILEIVNYKDFDIGVLVTTNKTIRTYNRLYRHKDKPTNILSFSYHPEFTPSKRIKVTHQEDKNLGDIILSLEYIKKEAVTNKVSPQEHLKALIIHAVCHLLGYDHETDSDWRLMTAKENSILKKLSKRSVDF